MKTVLMSPPFLLRGLLVTTEPNSNGFRRIDDVELAERLSYFLWADMPDDRLLELAVANQLRADSVLAEQIDRMLQSPKARNLAIVFGAQWLLLDEISKVSNNPPRAHASHSHR